MLLTDSVLFLPGVGEKQSIKLHRLGLGTINELFWHLPRYYRDTSVITAVEDVEFEKKVTLKVRVEQINSIRIRGGRSMQKGKFSDDSGTIDAVWFNQQFLPKILQVGQEVFLSGKLSPKSKKPTLSSPEYEVVKETTLSLGKIASVYPLTQGLKIKWLRQKMLFLLDNLGFIEDLREYLPSDFLRKHNLISIDKAFRYIHTPENFEQISLARRRLAYDELLDLFKNLNKLKLERKVKKSHIIDKGFDMINFTKEKLAFSLTESQLKAISDITADLKQPVAMNRLLQGDVGSGKTIVALLSAIPVVESGFQVVILAPTSVLASQHFDTFTKLLGHKYKINLVTSKTSKAISEFKNTDIIIATHSILFHKNTLIKKLGLLIIDEQHKFGVEQREQLLDFQKGARSPHVLNMTATPIPRSIALTYFGDIDVSVIEKPKSRLKIKSFVVPETKRNDSIEWIREKLQNGGKVFWICPLIEKINNDDELVVDVKAVDKLFFELKNIFPEFSIDLLHGKIKNIEKDRIIENFKNGATRILISTTVIEVGIDIPDANIIVIENSERFGLAQLHQLRGRVGRSDNESWCLLFTGQESKEDTVNRLNFFADESNGIKIAEFDLSRRGPGEVYGTIQSGIPNLKVANFTNLELIAEVRDSLKELI